MHYDVWTVPHKQQIALIGDQLQLRGFSRTELARHYGWSISLLERAEYLGGLQDCWRILDIQYRMHRSIAAFPSKQFYRSRLQAGNITRDLVVDGITGRPITKSSGSTAKSSRPAAKSSGNTRQAGRGNIFGSTAGPSSDVYSSGKSR